MTGFPWDRGYKPEPLDPDLYDEVQVLGAEGLLPLDHPAWRDEKWATKKQTQPETPGRAAGRSHTASEGKDCPHHGRQCAYSGSEPDLCPRCHRPWKLIRACKCDACVNHEAWHDRRAKSRARPGPDRRGT